MHKFENYIRDNKLSFETGLFEVLRIPSISADTSHISDMIRCAGWFVDRFERLGMRTELIQTQRHPLVYAETSAVPGNPVILIYGHYDVQPPDPIELWLSSPFEPTIRNGNVYARGATDDKGQFLTHLFAIESILKTSGSLPYQVKFIVEGEEEVGSESLDEFLHSETGKQKLACDCILISDTGMFAPDQPTITYGLRGIIAFELVLTGPNRDLHSGTFGGSVFNPAIALSKILGGMIDGNGKVQIPHFYDDVLPLTENEREQFASLSFDESEFFNAIGLNEGFGENGFSTNERRWVRPTFDINGITSGYQGDGSKTIIPSKASAKFTFRLVPNQSPERIIDNVKKYINSVVPAGIKYELVVQHGAAGMRLDLDKSRFVKHISNALENTFNRKPVFIREGGSIPIAANFNLVLGADVLLIGWGQDDDALHSPNEKFSLTSFHNGILASARFMNNIANNL
ncbi:MAG: dipeptidase [Planctomycetaceae bacterium]|jgi:succinyl-diaminopimelate desuccinylase|nr:dipeptidase [Planctomycetaceae bacterium]